MKALDIEVETQFDRWCCSNDCSKKRRKKSSELADGHLTCISQTFTMQLRCAKVIYENCSNLATLHEIPRHENIHKNIFPASFASWKKMKFIWQSAELSSPDSCRGEMKIFQASRWNMQSTMCSKFCCNDNWREEIFHRLIADGIEEVVH